MIARISHLAAVAVALLIAAASAMADEWPQIFEGIKGDDYVFVMLREDGRAVYLQRSKRPDGTIWLFYDDAATWKRTAIDRPWPNLSVQTKRFRFDYIFEKNQLTEWDKTGPQRVLQRQQNRISLD
jgi:hypothetical protein